MSDFKSKLASYKSMEFCLNAYGERINLKFPNTEADKSKTKIVEIGDDYIEFITTYLKVNRTIKTIAPVNMLYLTIDEP